MRCCAFCRQEQLRDGSRRDAIFCSKVCRQAAFRLRRRRATNAAGDRPIRVAYADPPYPGFAARYYKNEASYAGEVDHGELIARLQRDYPDGWALSTAQSTLREVLALCPPQTHIAPWVKPRGISPRTFGLANAWEPLLVVGGRQRQPGVRDFLIAHAARGGGELTGRKPLAFCAFLFDALGLGPGDALDDLFPGTGVVGRAWSFLSSVDGRHLPTVAGSSGDGSPEYSATRRSGPNDVSRLQRGDT